MTVCKTSKQPAPLSWSEFIPKSISEIVKVIVREVARGDEHYLRKVCRSQSTNQSCEPNETPNWFVLCDLEIFSAWDHHLELRATSRTPSFSIYNSFAVWIWLFRWEEGRGLCSRTFDHLFHGTLGSSIVDDLSHQLRDDGLKIECETSGNGKCELIVNFSAKMALQELKVQIVGKEKCKLTANFSATVVTSLPSLSVFVSFSRREHLAHDRQVSHDLGWPANAMFFFFFTQKAIFPCRSSTITWRSCETCRWGGRETRLNMFDEVFSKLLVPTKCFPFSGHTRQWVETKWRWLATQDHAGLVYTPGAFALGVITTVRHCDTVFLMEIILLYEASKHCDMHRQHQFGVQLTMMLLGMRFEAFWTSKVSASRKPYALVFDFTYAMWLLDLGKYRKK